MSGIVVNKATRQPIKDAEVMVKNDDNIASVFSSLPGSDAGRQNRRERRVEIQGFTYREIYFRHREAASQLQFA